MEYTVVPPEDFAALDLADWRYVLGAIHAEFRAGSYTGATSLAAAVADAAEAAVHHPDLAIRYPDAIRITLTTHAVGAVTTRDVELARTISSIADAAGAAAAPFVAQVAELAIDTIDADRIRPFWAAVLGYREVDGDLVDPMRQGPSVWFQQMDEPRTDRNRIHVDVSVPHDVADRRVADAIAAGGRLVSDARARAFWVLADPDGNEVCVCTWQDRS